MFFAPVRHKNKRTSFGGRLSGTLALFPLWRAMGFAIRRFRVEKPPAANLLLLSISFTWSPSIWESVSGRECSRRANKLETRVRKNSKRPLFDAVRHCRWRDGLDPVFHGYVMNSNQSVMIRGLVTLCDTLHGSEQSGLVYLSDSKARSG